MSNAEIIEMLKELRQTVSEMKISLDNMKTDTAEGIAANTEICKALNVKLDVFKNLEAESRDMITQAASSKRKPTRPAFFKKIFSEDREKYLNTLYTQEEIDAAFAHRDVTTRKKDADKITKVSSMLYATHIKNNFPEGRAAAFSSLYEQATNEL